MNIFHKFIPSEARRLESFIDAHFNKLEKRILKIMDELMKNLATANAEIKDRKTELAAMKIALDAANAAVATASAPPALPIGAMSADQVAAAVAASAELVVAAAP